LIPAHASRNFRLENRGYAMAAATEESIKAGFMALPQGHLAALVTYLVHDLARVEAFPLPDDHALERLKAGDALRYRALFQAVGHDWLWFSRLRLGEAALGAILGDDAVFAHALFGPNGDIGLMELDFRGAEPELAFFGLVPGAIGRGLGRGLMSAALSEAHRAGANALHVHTCSLDHPQALAFYMKCGFTPVRRGIEIFADPRLDGTLPKTRAPHLPLIE